MQPSQSQKSCCDNSSLSNNGGIPPTIKNIMGLANREGGNYITILDGKFCQRVSKDTVGAKERINKIGTLVYEKFYDKFTGILIGIKTQDSGAYGKNWVFSFKDGSEIYRLQLSYSNSFATAFLKMLPNIDVTKEITLTPSVKVGEDGKNKSSLFINQDGATIKHAYTRENPNGLPDMKQVQVKGQMVWDDTDRLMFLENMVKTTIIPKLEGEPSQGYTNPEYQGDTNSNLEKFVEGMRSNNNEEEDPF